jgi:serine/threonine protein phosphatase PrpC
MDTGATACVVLITPDKIYCSNAGDSRGCLSRSKKEVPLSYDHKPNGEIELARI